MRCLVHSGYVVAWTCELWLAPQPHIHGGPNTSSYTTLDYPRNRFDFAHTKVMDLAYTVSLTGRGRENNLSKIMGKGLLHMDQNAVKYLSWELQRYLGLVCIYIASIYKFMTLVKRSSPNSETIAICVKFVILQESFELKCLVFDTKTPQGKSQCLKIQILWGKLKPILYVLTWA